jgi:putative transposase
VGAGHLYQGRFKSFPVAQDDHFLRVCRYVERNAARAGLVRRAEVWRWCSLWQRAQEPRPEKWLLSAWPVVVAEADWVREVNRPQTEAELEALRRSVQRGQPYGEELWAERVARRLGLESTLRPRGRPRKAPADKGS